MTVRIKKRAAGSGLIHIVEEMSDVDLSVCYQCKKCTSGCPVANITESPPSEIVRRLHLGAGNELLGSDLVWLCLSCETCTARCPMDIDVASVMDALRALALERGASLPESDIPLFNRVFLKTLKTFGRLYELPMLAAYKIRTRTFMKDTDKFPTMLEKGKIALLPPSGADKRAVKRIFIRTLQNKGIGK